MYLVTVDCRRPGRGSADVIVTTPGSATPCVSLAAIFVGAVLPIVALVGVGALLGRLKEVDVDPLSTVTLYVLVPALVFHSLATTELSGAAVAKLLAGVTIFLVAMTGLAELVGRTLGEAEPLHSALVLAAVFPNSGNFGIPLSEFAFGATGRATAVVFLVGQSVVAYTLGVVVASRAGGAGGRTAVGEVFRLPLIYAVLAAGIARGLGLVPPPDSTAMATIRLAGDASIPLMLLLVGIELSRVQYGAALESVAVANGLKLLVAPVVGAAVALGLGFADPTVARVFVLECATPAAVTSLILLVEFSEGSVGGVTAPQFISSVVLTSTLLAIPVLTVLIAVLESGIVV